MIPLYVIAILSLPNVYGEAPANKTIANYNAAELISQIFNTNNTQLRANTRLVQFEDNMSPDLVYFNEFSQPFANYAFQGPVRYTDNNNNESDKTQIKFQDSKRRRKRKPNQHYGLGYPYGQNYASGAHLNSIYGGQYHRPLPTHPPPSLASEAVSRITEALTSIAIYDDYQCVARLLCEAAGGGALGSSGILQTVSGLEPLLTLLSAYNGLSTNPLFVFGRAVFLGMSSKGNTASCRYGYPLCPTDPEELVYYLNNHNGGFFRFFNAPQQGPQNVEQFYNQLSQNYGHQPQQHNQHYGFYNPNPGNQNYDRPNIYSNYGQNYGLAFPYNDNRIQKRIQNKPLSQYTDDVEEANSKWIFPNDNYINYNTFNDNSNTHTTDSGNFIKKGKALKFPEYNENNSENYNRNTKGFSFPESQSNRQYYYYNNFINSINDYNSNNSYHYNVDYANNNEQNDIRNDIRTVYVVRGNGDPNKPEIIKLRPGEVVY